MICKVKETIRKNDFLITGKTIVVGVSGGADSMALLNILLDLQYEYKLKLIVCHVNHGIRGETADRDEDFVVSYCKKNGIKVETLKVNVPELAQKESMSVEECGRKVRYDFFNSVCGDGLIATAHTLSDRCETLLFNITRGSSVKGLRSIPPKRDNIIRPLIDCSREDIEKYCNEKNIRYITDETNFDDSYSRNRIRLDVIPQLKIINCSFESAAKRLIDSATEDEEYFSLIVSDALACVKLNVGYKAEKIMNYPAAVRKRLIAKIILDETNVLIEALHIGLIEKILVGGKTEIKGNTVVEVKNGVMTVNPEKKVFQEWQFNFTNFYAETPNRIIKADIFNRNDLQKSQIIHNSMIDYDSIKGSLVLRNRRAGDKIRVAGSNCTKSLKKLFTERHTENRNDTPLLVDSQGIVWVSGIGCSDRCKITDDTQKFLIIREECKR